MSSQSTSIPTYLSPPTQSKNRKSTSPSPSRSQPSSTTPDQHQQDNDAADNIVTRLIITPILFLSFILSLFLVDRRNTSYRTTQHPSPPPTTLLAKLKHALVSPWQDAEPYRSGNHQDGKEEKWRLHSKHRKMMRMEVSDAFELRGKVVVGIVVFGLLAGLGVLVCGWWIWGLWIGGLGMVFKTQHSTNRPVDSTGLGHFDMDRKSPIFNFDENILSPHPMINIPPNVGRPTPERLE
ncbi:MAG: hypothetical protein M1812_005746 [Candelaria pacifica]|nr:MAG: hypothetical protein M1812_005746 [Candelaria pacifica]